MVRVDEYETTRRLRLDRLSAEGASGSSPAPAAGLFVSSTIEALKARNYVDRQNDTRSGGLRSAAKHAAPLPAYSSGVDQAFTFRTVGADRAHRWVNYIVICN